jgi:hypothetical protein
MTALEHIPFLRNRDVLQGHRLAHVPVGEPGSTSPGCALMMMQFVAAQTRRALIFAADFGDA